MPGWDQFVGDPGQWESDDAGEGLLGTLRLRL